MNTPTAYRQRFLAALTITGSIGLVLGAIAVFLGVPLLTVLVVAALVAAALAAVLAA